MYNYIINLNQKKMKTFKRISTALFLVLFLLATSNSYSQKKEEINTNLDKVSSILLNTKFTSSPNLKIINKSQLIKSESFYFKKINATITITSNDTNKKLLSIHDSSNTLSDEFIATVINKVNDNVTIIEDLSNEDINYMNTANTTTFGCPWWDLIFKVK